MIYQLCAFTDAVLIVLAVIALTAIVGAVLYFLVGLIISIAGDKNQTTTEEPVKQLTSTQEPQYLLNFDDTLVNTNNAVDLDKAKEEQRIINNNQKSQIDEVMESRMARINEKKEPESTNASDDFFNAPVQKPVEISEEDEDLEAQYQAILDEISNKVKEEEKPVTKKEPKEEDDDFDFDFDFDFDDDEKEEEKEEKVEPKKVEVVKEEPKQIVQVVEDTEKVKSLEEEIESLKTALEQERQAKIDAEEQKQKEEAEKTRLQAEIEEERLAMEEERLKQQEVVVENTKSKEIHAQYEEDRKAWEEEKARLQAEIANLKDVPEEVETLDSLEARLLNLQERLKVAEKELKANKKEYIPLARIKRTLQNDEAKLRRKEAIVAKQKITLFGVSNYVVDPEKEKKLAEDLDVLEALRLSVQHCEDVMRENADRYPILENTNKILVKTVKDLKDDVLMVQRKIDALKSGDAQ